MGRRKLKVGGEGGAAGALNAGAKVGVTYFYTSRFIAYTPFLVLTRAYLNRHCCIIGSAEQRHVRLRKSSPRKIQPAW